MSMEITDLVNGIINVGNIEDLEVEIFKDLVVVCFWLCFQEGLRKSL